MVRLKNTAGPEEAKTIMPTTNFSEGPIPPSLGVVFELRFWFAANEFDRTIGPASLDTQHAVAAQRDLVPA